MTNTHEQPPQDTLTGHAIRTDRPCAKCGFNLFNQEIIREPHYGLISARCPECGQLAALQEYPSLGKWASRWSIVLAILWVIVLVGAFAAHFMATFGISMASVEHAGDRFGYAVASEYEAHLIQVATESSPAPTYSFGPWSQIDPAWWAEAGPGIIERAGGPLAVIDWEVAWFWVPLTIISFLGGTWWSVTLLGSRRRWAALVALAPTTLVSTLLMIRHFTGQWGNTLSAREATLQTTAPVIILFVFTLAVTGALIGAWLGRRFARLVVRLTLPPRMRPVLGILWTRDNLPPPSASTL